MSNKPSFSFHMKVSNPESRTLHALDKEFRALAGGQESLVFPHIEPAEAARMAVSNWRMAPQPDGMWVYGSGGLPKGLIVVLNEFVRRYPQEISFTYSVSPEHPNLDAFGGGVVVINQNGHKVVKSAEAAERLISVARDDILGVSGEPKDLGAVNLDWRTSEEVQGLAARAIVELSARGPGQVSDALRGLHESVIRQLIMDAEMVLEAREENSPSGSF